MSVAAPPAWPGLSYGQLEGLLVELHHGPASVIAARFRKLRQRPFPGEIRTGTGKRIAYDLSRVLAVAAVFELNRLYVPQGSAVDMVENAWPEWARASLAAAVGLGAMARPHEMPRGSDAILRIAPLSMASETDSALFLTIPVAAQIGEGTGAFPTLTVDARRIVGALLGSCTAQGVAPGELASAFGELERNFGWTTPDMPRRATLSDVQIGRGFLEEGPYLARAMALLEAPEVAFDVVRHPARHARLEWLLDYLEDPAPVDMWKERAVTDESSRRLGQLLSMYAEERGLTVKRQYPGTMAAAAGELRDTALTVAARVREAVLAVD